MPWCEQCSRYWNPNSMTTSGQCPDCEAQIAPAAKAPWHFWALMAAVAGYLGWRLVQGLAWVVDKLV